MAGTDPIAQRPGRRAVAASLALSAAVLAALLWMEGAEGLASAVREAQPGYLALAVLADLGVIALVALRWSFVLARQGVSVPFARQLEMVAGSVALNNVLPSGRIAGDLVRPLLLERGWGVRKRVGYASVFVDKAFDFGFAFLLTTVFLAHLSLYGGLVGWGVVALSSLPLLALALAVARLGDLERLALGRVAEERREVVRDVFAELRTLRGDRRTLALCAAATVASIALLTARTWCIFAALGVEVGPLPSCELAILETMLASVPLTPGGVGLVEGGLVAFARALSIARGPTFTAVDRFISYWLRTLLGLALLGRLGSTWT